MPIYRTVAHISSPVLGGSGVNVFHVRIDPTSDQGHVLGTMMGHVKDWYTSINLLFSEDTTISWDGTGVTVDGDEPVLVQDDSTWSVPGGTTTPDLPPANALCVTWRSTIASRSGRGRTFLGPISKDILQDNGTPVEAARDTVQTANNALISSFSDPDGGALCVWSVKEKVGRDIVSASVPNEFAVLRSRRD